MIEGYRYSRASPTALLFQKKGDKSGDSLLAYAIPRWFNDLFVIIIISKSFWAVTDDY
jgi:hypothetical protein